MKNLILIAAFAVITSTAVAQDQLASNTITASAVAVTSLDNMNERQVMAYLQRTNNYDAYVQAAEKMVAMNDSRITELKTHVNDDSKASKKIRKNLIVLEKYNNELKGDLTQ